MVLGDLAFEETGKFAGVRVLPDGKVERHIRELANCLV
jgi:hypothetical protein